jgi:hypothetical protein
MIRTLLSSPFTIDRAGSLHSPTAAPAFYFLLGNVLAACYTVSLYGLLVPSTHSMRFTQLPPEVVRCVCVYFFTSFPRFSLCFCGDPGYGGLPGDLGVVRNLFGVVGWLGRCTYRRYICISGDTFAAWAWVARRAGRPTRGGDAC